MGDIQRYSIDNCGDMNCDPLISDHEGPYVEYADVKALIAENERLRTGMKGDYDLGAWLDWTAGRDQLKHDHDKWESLYRNEHASGTRLLDTLTGFRSERDQLKAEVERLRTAEGDAMTYKAGMENVAQQRDQLKAEVKELTGQLESNDEQLVALEKKHKALIREYEPMRKDAERWRFLAHEWPKVKLVENGEWFNSCFLEREIDAAMAKAGR